MNFTLYYRELGGHTHVRMYANGGKCGDLTFRNEEWAEFTKLLAYPEVKLIDETKGYEL